MTKLKVGEDVYWRGTWGTEAPKVARVTGIQITEHPRQKYGVEAQEASWTLVAKNRVVVDLSNGHWAYGEQIAPIAF